MTLLLVSGFLFACQPREGGPDDKSLERAQGLYSERNEEALIRHFFRDRRGGVFLDVGAGHYRNSSTTFYIEKHLGWTGIAIDALDEFAAGYKKNRHGTRFFNYIVCDRSGEKRTFYKVLTPPGCFTTSLRMFEEVRQKIPGARHEKIELPTIALNDLLKENGIQRIDFLSMDIECSELEALKGFDIEAYRPELVLIEICQGPEVFSYFDRHGYQVIDRYRRLDPTHNHYFRRRTRLEALCQDVRGLSRKMYEAVRGSKNAA